MEIKATLVGYLIYAAMAMYAIAAGSLLVSAVLRLARQQGGAKASHGLWRVLYVLGLVSYGIAFHVLMVAWAERWREVGHAPMQNMFEVFLTLAMLMFPISMFCRRFLKVGGEWFDALLGLILLVPAGFVFSAEPQHLPPALQSSLFIPHVSAYMISYVILFKGTAQAFMAMFMGNAPAPAAKISYEAGAYRMVNLGFPLLTLGLVLGAWWGKLAWGDYWNWDPKELWSLISWLVFLGYLHWRYLTGTRHPRANGALVVAGAVAIAATLLWVNLARIFAGGMHSYAS